MSILEVLQQAHTNAVANGRALYVLVDSAHAEYSHLKLDKWRAAYASLFQGTPEECLIEIAPLLIQASEFEDGLRHEFFVWVQNLAFASPAVSWFESAVGLPSMADHLRLFHTVGLSEGQTMLMRWYDTRILPVWFACLMSPQTDAFVAGTSHWSYVDRAGCVRSLPLAHQVRSLPPAPDLGRPFITLNDHQYALLVDAADLDVLIGHLRRVIPDELKRVPDPKLVPFVARYQQLAVEAGLNDIDRQTQFVLLALYTCGRAMEHPLLKAFMSHPPATLDGFVDGLQALPNEVWEAGQPLWKTESMPNSDSGQPKEFFDA